MVYSTTCLYVVSYYLCVCVCVCMYVYEYVYVCDLISSIPGSLCVYVLPDQANMRASLRVCMCVCLRTPLKVSGVLLTICAACLGIGHDRTAARTGSFCLSPWALSGPN
jgi:hypothetical protein